METYILTNSYNQSQADRLAALSGPINIGLDNMLLMMLTMAMIMITQQQQTAAPASPIIQVVIIIIDFAGNQWAFRKQSRLTIRSLYTSSCLALQHMKLLFTTIIIIVVVVVVMNAESSNGKQWTGSNQAPIFAKITNW